MKAKVQKFGRFLSSMVMPNIGAFIAWGFITALFIPDGWIPNEGFASIQPYMLTYLLPALIAFTGGKIVGGVRGGVMGAIAVMGCIAGVGGTEGQPMLMGAMVMGPLAGYIIKKFDQIMEGHMPAGFEMLINNFSVGILGMLVAMFGFVVIGPVMSQILAVLTVGVDVLVKHNLLPLSAIFIEPAKVLFLNNAINHGIFTPIGIEQAAATGKSIMYMLEANPGPGLGVLLAYWMFAKDKTTKQSAPGAIIIHFLGGIHEIYFPYILMNPLVIIAPIVGNICAITFFSITGCGLKAPASPGSIIAFLAMAPKDKLVFIIIGIIIATAVSFAIASPIIKMTGAKETDLEAAKNQVKEMKAESKGVAVAAKKVDAADVKKIVFACDAGMGSSAMGATKFRNRLKDVRADITVINTAVDEIPSDCDIAVVQRALADRARKSVPGAQVVVIDNFLADSALDNLYDELSVKKNNQLTTDKEPEGDESKGNIIIDLNGIKLGTSLASKEDAIRTAGELMVAQGYVDPSYVDAMFEREELCSTYMGMGVAIPHGTSAAKAAVKKTGIVFIQCPEGVDFGKEKAHLIFGVAGVGNEHLDLLSKVCAVLEKPEVLNEFKTTEDPQWILNQLT